MAALPRLLDEAWALLMIAWPLVEWVESALDLKGDELLDLRGKMDDSTRAVARLGEDRSDDREDRELDG